MEMDYLVIEGTADVAREEMTKLKGQGWFLHSFQVVGLVEKVGEISRSVPFYAIFMQKTVGSEQIAQPPTELFEPKPRKFLGMGAV